MASSARTQFAGLASQVVVVCLLAVFIVIALAAMYSTPGPPTEMEWIGMTVSPLEVGTAAALGIPRNSGGVVVEEVEGLAARAGVRQGDVLQRINGRPVRDMAGFSELAGRTDLAASGAQLLVNRRGLQVPLLVYPPAAASRMPARTAPAAPAPAPAVIDRRWLGIDAETLPAGEGRALGLPAGVAGVLIDGVARGGRAQQAGLIQNDVILSVNGQKVDSTAGLWSALAGLNWGDAVEFGVYRDGRLTSVALPGAAGALAGGTPGLTGGQGRGTGAALVCPNCGTRVIPQHAVARDGVPCPSCGTRMVRAR